MTAKSQVIAPPEASEHDVYYVRYISLVPGSDILRTLAREPAETAALISRFTEEQGDYRYAPEKWSVKEVLGHLIDTERILSYRALRIARHDQTSIEGFEQDDYVRHGGFGNRTLAELSEEFQCIRRASLFLFRNLDAEAWMRRGVANQKEISVRALAYVIAGHELHHRRILRERYMTA
jgi:DinB family protein